VSAIAMPDDNASVIDGFIPPSSSPTVPLEAFSIPPSEENRHSESEKLAST
jgi:hypothetical protein